jgi:hypothetical protein
LPILLHVDEFVKQQSIRERLVRDHNITKRNGCHCGLVREIVEAQASQHRVEIWVGHPFALQHEESRAIEKLGREESIHGSPLLYR